MEATVACLIAVERMDRQQIYLMRQALQKKFIIVDDISQTTVMIRTPKPKHTGNIHPTRIASCDRFESPLDVRDSPWLSTRTAILSPRHCAHCNPPPRQALCSTSLPTTSPTNREAPCTSNRKGSDLLQVCSKAHAWSGRSMARTSASTDSRS
jgi:hypothetical protein